jgi:excisionase family DNA binding protein
MRPDSRLKPAAVDPGPHKLLDQPPGACHIIERLLSIDELTTILNCSRPTIERMRAAGRLPRPDIHVGRRCPRWKPETIRAWIERGGHS